MGRQNEIILARLDGDIADRHVGKMTAPELRPALTAVNRHVEPEFSAEKKQIGALEVLLDDVRITANRLQIGRRDERGPRLAIIARPIDVGGHVAVGMQVEGRIGCAGIEVARLHPVHPGALRQPPDIADHIPPLASAILGDLQAPVIGPGPDDLAVLRGFADREDSLVHLGRRIVDRDAAGLFLFLMCRVIRRQIRRNALPALSVVFRAQQELAADINRAALVGGERNRRIPVETQLFILDELCVIQQWMNVPRIRVPAIHAVNGATLALRINVRGVRGIFIHPEAVVAVYRLPLRVGDATRMNGLA